MTTYSPTASSPRFGHLSAHLGAYVAGVGATAALTAGALVAFLSVATFVAFSGFPFGGSSDDAGSAYLESTISAAPTAAGLALGVAPDSVSNDPAGGSGGGASAGSAAAGGSGGSGGSGSSGPGGDGSGKAPVSGPSDPGASSPSGHVSSPPISVPSLHSTSGPVTNGVQAVDGAAGTNVSGPSRDVTRTVDGAGTGALNQGGGAVGRPRLGTQAGSAVSGTAGSALGG